MRHAFLGLLLASAAMLAACATAPEPQAVTEVTAPPLPTEWYQQRDDVVPLNTGNLKIFIRVGKTGSLANLGHEHAIEVSQLAGFAFWPDRPSDARADIEFELENLQVDTEAAKAALGVDNQLNDEEKADTRENMLKSLEANQYPRVRVQLRGFTRHNQAWRGQASVWLHGTRNDYPITLETGSEGLRQASAELSIRQTEFGIQPFSALNGNLQVADELHLSISFKATAQE